MHDDRPDPGNTTAPCHSKTVTQDPAAGNPALDIILQIDASLEAIRKRIDEAYNHICLDLPEVNMEIYRTFQQAFDTLDSLSAHDSPGTIAGLVEGIEITLQNVMIRTRHLRKHDAHILETLMLTCEPLSAGHDGLGEGIDRFSAVRDELISVLENILGHEESLIQGISTCLGRDLKSHEKTLSSVVAILKDLIFRSNSVKEPILKIMSGLQTHDIVNQDISTISLGMRKMYSLRSVAVPEDAHTQSLLFQEKASVLSRRLVSQLIDVIRHHGSDLQGEIDRIERMVFHIKEDKDALSDFLLTRHDGMSTFDFLITDVLQMFTDITARIDFLSACKERQQSLSAELTELCSDLDGRVSARCSSPLNLDLLAMVEKRISPLKSGARMLRCGNGLKELRENLWSLHRDSDLARHKLEEIKVLLLESIRGIDTYSGRCIDAITKFKQDIQELMTTLDGSDRLLEDLDSISMANAQAEEPLDGSPEPCTILPADLSDIIYRLENPHSSSLAAAKQDFDMDEGLTLF